MLVSRSKTHAEIISNVRITFSGYEKTQTCHSRLFLAAHSVQAEVAGGVCIIKMVPVMGLITLIVFTTGFYFNFPREISGIPLPSLGSL